MNQLKRKAYEIIELLQELPQVTDCRLYGSLEEDTADEMSDIDIEVDVSGSDNGQFMLSVVDILKNKLDIFYYDYAPGLIPDMYVVSMGIDENNPFIVLDLSCVATPHCTTVTKEQAMSEMDKYTHTLKVWIANLKHFVRGKECYMDIVRMAGRLGIKDLEIMEETEILENVLIWLENNAMEELIILIESCRRAFDELLG